MLFRKMWRDIKGNLSQFITIFLMVMIGVMAYSGISAYMKGMKETVDKFYSENNLQDLNVLGDLKQEDIEVIKEIDNVENALGKLEVTATSDDDKTLLVSFIKNNDISKFYCFDGVDFDVNKKGVWLDNYYALENNIKIGDTITIKYDKFELKEQVLGLINVPDHIYDLSDESELYPDRKKFGFAYLSWQELPIDAHYNYIMVDVDNKDNVDDVKNAIMNKVSSALAVIKIEDTTSYSTYQGEIDEGKTYVGVFSGLFLFIAMLSVITTMTRVIKKERMQIGTLKALGFSNGRILFHYVSYGFVTALAGAICGLVLGYFFIGKIFISLEMAVFEVPNGHPVMSFQSYVVAFLVVLVVSLISVFTGLSILKENTAEALRNKIPSVKSSSLRFTRGKLFKKLNFASKWNLRDIIRNKMRTLMGIAGVVGCAMLIVCALGMLDSMNHFVDLQFTQLYYFDYKLNLQEGISDKKLKKLENKYGNNSSRTYGIEIIDGDKKEANNIFVTDANDYVRFVDNKDNFIDLDSNSGVYVTYKLASQYNYKLGDKITWHIYGSDEYYSSEIVGFNKDPQNQNITMRREYLESLGIKYEPDSLYTNKDLKDIKEIDGVSTIQDIDSLKNGMNKMLSMMKTMLVLIIGIAILLGAIIIYNLGILSYTEKQYQFATLKVLGFSDNQIKKVFVKQNNWIAVVSVIIGVPLGYYLTDWLFKTALDEHYDFSAYITWQSYVIGALGTLIISYLVSRILALKIKNIDMVSSLKGNE